MSSRYGLTEQERERIRAVPWPRSARVAEQIDAERAGRERQAAVAADVRRYQEGLEYAAHTRRRADEETRKHSSGQRCDPMCCYSSDHLDAPPRTRRR
jgi:hypothetical protein